MKYLRMLYDIHRAHIRANFWRGLLRLVMVLVFGWGIVITGTVSSFFVFRRNFDDMPAPLAIGLGATASIMALVSFFWFTFASFKDFTSRTEKAIAYLAAYLIFLMMVLNALTQGMILQGYELTVLQSFWLQWGADILFVTVLLFVLLLTLNDPIIRLAKLEMAYYRINRHRVWMPFSAAIDADLNGRTSPAPKPKLTITIRGWKMLVCLWWLTGLSFVCIYQAALDLQRGRLKTAAIAILLVLIFGIGFRLFCLRRVEAG